MRKSHKANHLVTLPVMFCVACLATEPDNMPPVMEIIAPARDVVFFVGDTVEIIAEAYDTDGSVRSVEFFVDGRPIGYDTLNPFAVTWHTAGESRYRHQLRALALDDDDASATHSVVVLTSWVYERPEEVGDGWDTASLTSVGMDTLPFVNLMNALRSNEDHRTHGVLISRHGRLVFEQYFAGHRRHDQDVTTAFGRDTIHDLASVTKSVTSTLLGIAIDRGKIADVHQSLFGYFPEYAHLNDGSKDGVELQHVVTMTAGLEWNEWGFALTDDRNDLVQFNQAPDPLAFALAKPMVAEPGTVFAYSGANSMLLGDAIRRASGIRLDSLAQEYLFTPLGINDLDWKYYRHISPDLVAAHGDLELRPRDMLKLGELYLRDGVWNGEQIISTGWVQTAATPYYSFPNRFTGHLEGLVGYSHGWWVRSADYGSGAFSASGWGDQAIIVLPEYDMVAVFTGGSYWEMPFLTSHEMMVDYVLPSILAVTPSAAPKPGPPS